LQAKQIVPRIGLTATTAKIALVRRAAPRARLQQQPGEGAGDGRVLRHLFNRMLGQLHYCPLSRTHFDESIAFPAAAGAAV
jgi:hypothetical protein